MSDRAELLLELKRRVGCCINAAEAKLHTLSKDIWSCPELAYEETKAHDRLVTFFSQEECWTVDSHFKLETAFRATWGAGGRDVVSVCFLCDSLPDIRHACGHNLIAEVGAAAAVGLKAVLEDIQELAAQVQKEKPNENILKAASNTDRNPPAAASDGLAAAGRRYAGTCRERDGDVRHAFSRTLPSRLLCVWCRRNGDDQAQFFTLRTAKTLAMTALNVLLDPELLQKVKQEFTEAKLREDRKLTGEHTEQAAK
ncbi:peptidase M20 domain-containing protein 2-like [Sparus aurata]|uniref:peptidase M20 domain-containing protein 2-like n=1 Tax=Sparus aurata TaxID=8175 RepID=UPI0011C0D484|nr:peptidase M20 domain-containing protein 2-like [Sparus aurata]